MPKPCAPEPLEREREREEEGERERGDGVKEGERERDGRGRGVERVQKPVFAQLRRLIPEQPREAWLTSKNFWKTTFMTKTTTV